jgi:hypothetical protein
MGAVEDLDDRVGTVGARAGVGAAALGGVGAAGLGVDGRDVGGVGGLPGRRRLVVAAGAEDQNPGRGSVARLRRFG